VKSPGNRPRLSPWLYLAMALLIRMVAAQPAWAADLSIKFLSAPVSGSELTGVWPISVEASAASFLQRFSVGIQRRTPSATAKDVGLEEIAHGPWTLGNQKQDDNITATWDTRGNPPIYNGIYDLIATATTQDGHLLTQSVTDLRANNPSPPPPPPRAYSGWSDAVLLEINQVKDPDILRYAVERSIQPPGRLPSAFVELPNVDQCNRLDRNPPTGEALRYRVIAVRASPIQSDGIRSSPSAASDPATVSATDPSVGSLDPGCGIETNATAGQSFFELTGSSPTPSSHTQASFPPPSPTNIGQTPTPGVSSVHNTTPAPPSPGKTKGGDLPNAKPPKSQSPPPLPIKTSQAIPPPGSSSLQARAASTSSKRVSSLQELLVLGVVVAVLVLLGGPSLWLWKRRRRT